MNVEYLIQLLSNKLVVLNNAKAQAYQSGDLATINAVDEEILNVQGTLSQLRLVQQVTAAAAASNTTSAQVVATGLVNVSASTTVPNNPTAVLSQYDLSTYAADPMYMHKITDILSVMPAMDTTQVIDAYIASEAIGSPLNGQMILGAAQQYAVDTRLLMTMFELESNFGTAGVAVATMNPGNVGNTGTTTRTYNSWQDGVAAVAQWLSVHPAATAVVQIIDPSTLIPQHNNVATSTATSTLPIPPMNPNAFTQQATTTSPIASSTQQTASAISTSTATSTLAAASSTGTTGATTGTSTSSVNLGDYSGTGTTTATSTGATTATSTDSVDLGDYSGIGSTTATSTSTGTSTSPINLGDYSGTGTTTATSTDTTGGTTTVITGGETIDPIVTPTATTTPDTNASSTQAFKGNGKSRRA